MIENIESMNLFGALEAVNGKDSGILNVQVCLMTHSRTFFKHFLSALVKGSFSAYGIKNTINYSSTSSLTQACSSTLTLTHIPLH